MIKSTVKILTILLILTDFTCWAQTTKVKDNYNEKEFHNLFNIFKYKSDLINYFDIKSGDIIADVGTSDGTHIGALSLLYDSLTLYGEDLDAKYLNQKSWDKMVNHYSSIRGNPQTNKFHFVLGTEKETKLPNGIFDKIIIMGSFHEFTFMDEMIADMDTKLKAGGKIIIQDAFSLKNKVIYCTQKHRGMTIDSAISVMEKHGFYLTKIFTPESGIINYSNVLTFEKDKVKSDTFLKQKEKVEAVINRSFLLDQKDVASDSIKTTEIAVSLEPFLNDITASYLGFESWLREIGNKWSQTKDYTEAINVLVIATRLFPNSYLSYSCLGEAYEKNKQNKQALFCYKKASILNPDIDYQKKIKILTRKVDN